MEASMGVVVGLAQLGPFDRARSRPPLAGDHPRAQRRFCVKVASGPAGTSDAASVPVCIKDRDVDRLLEQARKKTTINLPTASCLLCRHTSKTAGSSPAPPTRP